MLVISWLNYDDISRVPGCYKLYCTQGKVKMSKRGPGPGGGGGELRC